MAEREEKGGLDYSPVPHSYQTPDSGSAIYLTALAAVIALLIALPLVKINVSIAAQGYIQAAVGRTGISAPFTGRVGSTIISDNRMVRRGDTLLIFDVSAVSARIESLQKRKGDLARLNSDFRKITSLKPGQLISDKPINLQTQDALQSLADFRNELSELHIDHDQLHTAYLRYQKLFEQHVVSVSEFELHRTRYERSRAEIQIRIGTRRGIWRQQLSAYQEDLRLIEQDLAAARDEAKAYVLKAPFTGTLHNVRPLGSGSVLLANEAIADISPDSTLLAWCSLSSSDIGLIRPGQEVKLQIGAYNYRQWGTIPAKVAEIDADASSDQTGKLTFTVKCIPDRNYLSLPSGQRGYIRKGMDLNARFVLGSRSIYQLLRDQVEDWANPFVQADDRAKANIKW